MIKELIHDSILLARKSEKATIEDLQVAQDLLDTLIAHKDGCVGMAANMIGVNKRIIAFDNDGTYASEFGIRYHGLPEGADASFFLCKELKKGYLDGISGEYAPPKGYFVDEAEAEEFDKQFPPKEKLKLPTQLF